MALFALRFLIGCQAEEKIGNEMHNHVQDGVEVSYLKGEEANIARQKLISKLQSENTIEILESTPIALRTNEGTIDFNTIVQVIDTLGIKNYTFRVINHPEDDYKTFHNLILTEKETTMEVKMFEYEMTDTFAQEYFAQLKSFQQFQGALRVSGVALISQPCDELEIEYPGDSSGGGGGGDSPGDSTPGDGSTSGSSVGGCVQTFLTIECSCGRSYNSWNAYEGSICGSGMYPGYSISVTVTFVYNTLCKNTQDPCNPDGTVGVLTPQEDCNTFEKRINEVLNFEGGYVNDPNDSGGETNKGITFRTFQNTATSVLNIQPTHENFINLTTEQAKLIYKHQYWNSISCDEIIDGDLRFLLFDFYVNAGPNAIKQLKKTLNQLGYNVVVNGIMTQETLDIINSHNNVVELYNTFKQKRIDYYNSIVDNSVQKYMIKYPNATATQVRNNSKKKYQTGWLNRANSFKPKTVSNPNNVNC